MIVLINTIFLPLCKQKLYIIAIFCIGSSSVLLVGYTIFLPIFQLNDTRNSNIVTKLYPIINLFVNN